MDNIEDITLQGSEAVWVMPRTESITGGTYTGTFRFRCFLDPIRELQAGREYRELLGKFSQSATDIESRLAWCLSQLKQRILISPPFWSSTAQDGGIAGNIGDLAILTLVTEAAFRAQDLFKEKIQKERDDLLDKAIRASEQKLKKDREDLGA